MCGVVRFLFLNPVLLLLLLLTPSHSVSHPLQEIRIGPNWDEYERKRISERTFLKDRKRTYVQKCTSDVRNHFLRPIYKRPEILSNWIIMRTNPGTIGLIRRKVAFHFFLAVRTGVRKNILEVFSAVRTVVEENILEVCYV